jgi:hypothetical protein
MRRYVTSLIPAGAIQAISVILLFVIHGNSAIGAVVRSAKLLRVQPAGDGSNDLHVLRTNLAVKVSVSAFLPPAPGAGALLGAPIAGWGVDLNPVINEENELSYTSVGEIPPTGNLWTHFKGPDLAQESRMRVEAVAANGGNAQIMGAYWTKDGNLNAVSQQVAAFLFERSGDSVAAYVSNYSAVPVGFRQLTAFGDISFSTVFSDSIFDSTVAGGVPLALASASGLVDPYSSLLIGNFNATDDTYFRFVAEVYDPSNSEPFYDIGAVYAVPEPSTYAMALAGLVCGGYSMFRRRKRA